MIQPKNLSAHANGVQQLKKNEQILDDFYKYVEEQRDSGHRESNTLSYIQAFARVKTKNGLYHELNDDELKILLKKLIANGD